MVFDNDSEQVLRLHLKVMQIGREGWVVVQQLTVGVHDLLSSAEAEDPRKLPCASQRL